MEIPFSWEGLHRKAICKHGAWARESSITPNLLNYIDAFAKSAEKGCSPCKMLLDAVDEFKPGWITTERRKKKIELRAHGAALFVGLHDPDTHFYGDGFQLYCRSPGRTVDLFKSKETLQLKLHKDQTNKYLFLCLKQVG